MEYAKLLEIIRESDKEEWLFNDERGVYTYKGDLNIRIERRDSDLKSDKFTGEDWATNHPDPNAYRVIYELYYGSSFIKEKLLVSVDGHRATLPLPDIKTREVDPEDYHFAEIVDQLDTLSEYMERSGLRLRNV